MTQRDLLAGLGATPGADGVTAFAADYDRRPFAGRARELAALDAWRASGARFLLVVAPAGRGKSALLHRWAAAAGDVAWIPISARFGTARGSTARALLTARLKGLGVTGVGDWTDTAATAPIVALDGLDEASDDLVLDDLRRLARVDGPRVIVAARELVDRDAPGWAAHLGWDDAALVDLGGLDRAAVGALLGARHDDPETLSQVMRISDGDPLVASLLADAVHQGLAPSATLADVRAGLDGVFTRWLGDHAGDPTAAAVCAGLASAAAPVPPDLLAEVLDLDRAAVDATLERLARLVVTAPGGAVAFAHPRFGYHVREPLPDAARGAIDAAFAAVTTRRFARVLAGPPIDADAVYTLTCHRLHLERAGTALDDLITLLDPRWLAAWETLEGGTGGFVGDVLGVWRAADRVVARGPDLSAMAVQVRCQSLAQLLRTSEGALAPAVRREAVLLGLRSQRAAIASLATIDRDHQHGDAARLLLEVLDDAGFDALLTTAGAPDPSRWPAPDIAARLLDRGRQDEARAWLVAMTWGRADAIGALLERFAPGHREALRALVLAEARAVLGDEVEDAAEIVATAARVVPDAASELLGALTATLDGAADDDLYWDSYEGSRDPRGVLAEAWARRGEARRVRALVARILAAPYPMATRPVPAGPDVVAVVARCAAALATFGEPPLAATATGPAAPTPGTRRSERASLRSEGPGDTDPVASPPPPAPLLDAAALAADAAALVGALDGARRLEAELALAAAGLEHDRAALLAGLAAATDDAAAVLRAVAEGDDAELARAATLRLGLLAREGASALAGGDADARYRAGYTLYHGGLEGLGAGAPHLSPTEAAEDARVLWDDVLPHDPPAVRFHGVLSALVPLLARALDAGEDDDARRIADALLADALGRKDPATLCDREAWRRVWDDATRRRYVTALATRRTLDHPRVWGEALAGLVSGDAGDTRDAVAELALDIALEARDEALIGAATGAASPVRWPALAERVLAAYRETRCGGWALDALRRSAPRPEDAARIARVAFESIERIAPLGCVGDLLGALPDAEREATADALVAAGFGDPRPLPPAARARWLERRRAEVAGDDVSVRASFTLQAASALSPEALAAEVDALMTELRIGLPTAPDERGRANPSAPVWSALGALVRLAPADALATVHDAVRERGPESVATSLAWRWGELGEPEREAELLAHLAKPRDVDRVRLALVGATPESAVAVALARDPKILTYPWLASTLAARGVIGALVAGARALPPGPRLVAWDLAWPHLAPHAQAALLPEVAEVALDEPFEPPTGRWRWLDRLPLPVVRALWRRDMASTATHGGPRGWLAMPFPHYAPRLAAGAPFAAALADVVAWFVDRTPGASHGSDIVRDRTPPAAPSGS